MPAGAAPAARLTPRPTTIWLLPCSPSGGMPKRRRSSGGACPPARLAGGSRSSGCVLKHQGKYVEAEAEYRRALYACVPTYSKLTLSTAAWAAPVRPWEISGGGGGIPEALRLRPGCPEGHYGLANCCGSKGSTPRRRRSIGMPCVWVPGFPEAHGSGLRPVHTGENRRRLARLR